MTFHTLPCRCEVCHRVRQDGQDWEDHPGRLPNEVLGRCGLHGGKATEDELRRKSWREYGKVERKKAKGFGPPPKGSDPLAGF